LVETDVSAANARRGEDYSPEGPIVGRRG